MAKDTTPQELFKAALAVTTKAVAQTAKDSLEAFKAQVPGGRIFHGDDLSDRDDFGDGDVGGEAAVAAAVAAARRPIAWLELQVVERRAEGLQFHMLGQADAQVEVAAVLGGPGTVGIAIAFQAGQAPFQCDAAARQGARREADTRAIERRRVSVVLGQGRGGDQQQDKGNRQAHRAISGLRCSIGKVCRKRL